MGGVRMLRRVIAGLLLAATIAGPAAAAAVQTADVQTAQLSESIRDAYRRTHPGLPQESQPAATPETLPDAAPPADGCAPGPDQTAIIAACSAVIADAARPPAERAQAYLRRGVATVILAPDDSLAERRAAAAEDFDKAVALDPGLAEAHYYRGLVSADADQAIASFETAGRLGMDVAAPLTAGYGERAARRAAAGDAVGAIADYTALLALDADSVPALFGRARASIATGDNAAAVADLVAAGRLARPDDALRPPIEALLRELSPPDYDALVARLDAPAEAVAPAQAAPAATTPAEATRPLSAEAAAALERYRLAVQSSVAAIARANMRILLAQGWATVTLTVAASGELVAARLEDSSGSAAVEEAVLLSTRQAAPFPPLPAALGTAPRSFSIAVGSEGAAVPGSEAAPVPQAPRAEPAPPVRVETPLPGRRIALVIGNRRYRHGPELPGAEADAHLVAGALADCGFTVTELADGTRTAMLAALDAVSAEAGAADWVVLYYAGYGISMAGNNFLVPTDARLAEDWDILSETVGADRLLVAAGPARLLRVVILDASRDNPFIAPMRRTISDAGGVSGGVSGAMAPVDPPVASLVALPARPGRIAESPPGDGPGPYAQALAANLCRPGVEIDKAFRLVRDDVWDASGHRQEPMTYSTLPGRTTYALRP